MTESEVKLVSIIEEELKDCDSWTIGESKDSLAMFIQHKEYAITIKYYPEKKVCYGLGRFIELLARATCEGISLNTTLIVDMLDRKKEKYYEELELVRQEKIDSIIKAVEV